MCIEVDLGQNARKCISKVSNKLWENWIKRDFHVGGKQNIP